VNLGRGFECLRVPEDGLDSWMSWSFIFLYIRFLSFFDDDNMEYVNHISDNGEVYTKSHLSR